MITIRKLATMGAPSRLRKIALLFRQCSVAGCDDAYLASLVALAQQTAGEVFAGEHDLEYLTRLVDEVSPERRTLALLDAHYLLSAALGETVADWDREDDEGTLDRRQRIILERYLVLDRIRSPYNVGSIFRSADSFGIKEIFLIEGSADPQHNRALRTSAGTIATVDYQIIGEDELFAALAELNLPLFALESGGGDITHFAFPESGVAILGSEELGVTSRLLRRCDASLGRVSIMMGGTKGSLNVSSAAAIMLQRWYSP
ncbi:MAG: TrmH family RNA methyltransferase [Sphaerochaeta sp.]|nr:TrmH family RNA methyltransferase [Sphaerochaeta sp.]